MKNIEGKLAVIILFALVVNFFLYQMLGSIFGVSIFVLLWIMTVGAFGRFARVFYRSPELYSLIMTVTGSAVVATSDNPVRVVVATLAVLITLLYTVYVLLRGYTPKGVLETILAPIQVVMEYLGSVLRILVGSKEVKYIGKINKGKKSEWMPYLLGILVGLPIAIVLTSILTQADPVFFAFVKRLVSEEVIKQLPVRMVVTILVGVFWLPILVMRLRQKFVSPLSFLSRRDYSREMMVIVAMVVIVLTAFLRVQWPYVFAKVARETELTKYGVATYSEYVQKGFAELTMATIMVLVISASSLLVLRNKGKIVKSRLLVFCQAILGIEFVIFVISIYRRVFLYTEYHGLTLARIYGLVFLLWLTGMAVTLALRFVRNRSYLKLERIWSLLILFFVLFANTERWVAMHPPTVNGKADYVYTSFMSADGYPGWVAGYRWASAVLEQENVHKGIINQDGRRNVYYAQWIVQRLMFKYSNYVVKYGNVDQAKLVERENEYSRYNKLSKILSFNWGEKAAYLKMRDDQMTYEELDKLRVLATDLMDRINLQPKDERSVDIDISRSTPFVD